LIYQPIEGCDELTTKASTAEAPPAPTEVQIPSECARTQYECCLDGVQTASGPNFAGCPEHGSYTETCEDSAFGCCPDGVSAAIGPFNAGCAYQHQIARQ